MESGRQALLTEPLKPAANSLEEQRVPRLRVKDGLRDELETIVIEEMSSGVVFVSRESEMAYLGRDERERPQVSVSPGSLIGQRERPLSTAISRKEPRRGPVLRARALDPHPH